MFNHLTDFKYTRNPKEAVGFYFAYLVIFILAGGLITGLMASITNSEGVFQFSLRVINFVIIVAILVVSALIMKEKHLYRNLKLVAVVLLAGLLAVFGGGILGLIPVAYLTTLPFQRSDDPSNIWVKKTLSEKL